MVQPVVVTVIWSGVDCPCESVKCAVHCPAATGLTEYVADGPCALDVVIVASPLQLSLSPNVPLYELSDTFVVVAYDAPAA